MKSTKIKNNLAMSRSPSPEQLKRVERMQKLKVLADPIERLK